MEKKEHFPVFIKTSNKKVLVVGGGKIAERRIKTLSNFNFLVTVIAKEISEAVKSICHENAFMLIEKPYSQQDIDNYYMVLACTNDFNCNQAIKADCQKASILVNVADSKENCDFYFPGIVVNDDITIGAVGNGDNHKGTKNYIEKVKRAIE